MQINPVIEKDLKIKMRGWKAPALISVYLGFLGLIAFIIFQSSNPTPRYGSGYYSYDMGIFNPTVALSLYITLAIFQFMLVLFITPALTGGAISNERERQTLDLLLCTNLSPLSIITGKITVSIAHILLLITAALPIMGTVFLFGGIKLLDILMLFGFYIVTALMLASIGIFYSTIFKKSLLSMILTYITLLFLVAGTFIIFIIWGLAVYGTGGGGGSPNSTQVMCFFFANPLFGFASIFEGLGDGAGSLVGLFSTSAWSSFKVIKPWMANITFDIAVSVIFILLSAYRLRPVKKRSSSAADIPVESEVSFRYAGFWRRFASYIIDNMVLGIILLVLFILIGIVISMAGGFGGNSLYEIMRIAGYLIMLTVVWLYYALFESSKLGATPGKMLLGIAVADSTGGKVSFLRASGRFFGKALSGMILFIGYLITAFTPKKQALHDIISGSLVIRKEKAINHNTVSSNL